MHLLKRLAEIGLCIAVFWCWTGLTCQGEDWPNWRGPNGNGVSNEKDLPVEWSAKENIEWRTPLAEPGNSSPVVVGNRVFITQPLAKEKKRSLMCFDRRNGKLEWQQAIDYDEKEETHDTNPYCSASPVSDGERVIVWYGSAGLYSYLVNGELEWRLDLGKQNHEWGYGTSPILYKDLCILQFGPGKPSFVVALKKQSGEEVWRVPLPDPPAPVAKDDTERKVASDQAEKKGLDRGGDDEYATGADGRSRGGIFFGSWATPMIVRSALGDELIVAEPAQLSAYNPASGKRNWFARGLGALVYASPMHGENTVVALGGYHTPALAVRIGGSGDVSTSHRVWQAKKTKLRLGTGVVHDRHLYLSDMASVAECQNLATGEQVWQKRLAGTGGRNDTWSSMVLADENIYLLNQSGDTFVFRASPEYQLLATNSLGEATNSSIAVSGGKIFIRTHESLWCVGGDGGAASN